MFVFKVAQLRNIERTYPYFHDGSVWKLDDAVRVMGEAQLGKMLAAATRSRPSGPSSRH